MAFGDSTKGKRFPVEVLTPEEVRALMGRCSNRGLCGVRDRALIAMLYRAGLRIGEARALEPRDVSLEDGIVNVRDGKGHKQRFVAIDEETVALVRHWLDVRNRRGLTDKQPLFCTLAGAPLSREQVTGKLKFLAAEVGIQKRVHPHGLRHTLATELANERVDLRVIQGVLGHTNAATTDRYIRHLPAGAVVEAMRDRKWK